MGNLESLERMQFVPGWTYFHLKNGFRLDIMISMKGLEGFSFEECYNMASVATIYDIEVRFLHINHLIDNKKSVNRPKDQLDVIKLEKIRQILEETNKK